MPMRSAIADFAPWTETSPLPVPLDPNGRAGQIAGPAMDGSTNFLGPRPIRTFRGTERRNHPPPPGGCELCGNHASPNSDFHVMDG